MGVIVLLFLSGTFSSSDVVESENKSIKTGEQVDHIEEIDRELEQSSDEVVKSTKEENVKSEEKSYKNISAPNSNNAYYLVTGVVDGDTIKININGKEETLRLIGLDTPETVDPRKSVQCFGKEASSKAKELLSGKKVRIETDSTQGDRDKYNRLLAYIYREDGLFYNKYMIEQGYAHEYTYSTPYKYQSDFKTAQKNAQSAQLGLWSPNTCNGNTTSSAETPPASNPETIQSSGFIYYTSSHHTAKYYYPEDCSGWKSLSTTYLKSYSSLDSLLAVYPSKTKSPQCD